MAGVAYVTGATGFVGLNLVDQLLENGWHVHAMLRHGSSRAEMLRTLPHALQNPSLLSLVWGDLKTSELTDLVEDDCDVIFHLCLLAETTRDPLRTGPCPPGFTSEGGAEHIRINLNAMDNVIRAAKAKNVRRVIYCSSWSAYGQHTGEITEDSPSLASYRIGSCWGVLPIGSSVAYFVGKRKCEERLIEAMEQREVRECVILEPGSIFGRFGEGGWCGEFQRIYNEQGKGPILPGGSTFVEVQALAKAFEKAATVGDGKGERYIMGGVNATSLAMSQMIAKMVGVPPPSRSTPAAVLWGIAHFNEFLLKAPIPFLHYFRIFPSKIPTPHLLAKVTQDMQCNSKRAQSTLGYCPVSLADMLQNNLEWLLKARKLKLKEPLGS